MSLDFYIHLRTERSDQEVIDDLRTAFDAREGQARYLLLLPGLLVLVQDCDFQLCAAIEKETAVRPNIVVVAELIALEDDLGNDPLLVAILDHLLQTEDGDLVFDYNCGSPELRRLKGDTVIYREEADRSLLNEEHRALLTVPYRLEERFPG